MVTEICIQAKEKLGKFIQISCGSPNKYYV